MRGIRLVERLGQGGMGDVYLGLDERLQRRVAVKALRPDWRPDATARARLLREARVLSQLEHPNVCRLYEYLEAPEGDFLVLELVPGRPLRELIGQPRPRREQLRLAIEMAESLVAAHALSVVHRDFKPENVMVTPDGHVKVLDFGLAKSGLPDAPPPAEAGADASGSGGSVTELGAVLGPPRYMSPEQARGEPPTAASDMYSFGLVLQELLTGRSPLPEGLSPALLRQKAMWGEERAAGGAAQVPGARRPSQRPGRPRAAARHRRRAPPPGAPGRRRRGGPGAGGGRGPLHARLRGPRPRRARQAQAEAEAVNAFLAETLASADPRALGIDVKVVDVLGAPRARRALVRRAAGPGGGRAARARQRLPGPG